MKNNLLKILFYFIITSSLLIGEEKINHQNEKIYSLEKVTTQASMSELPLEEQSLAISIIPEDEILQNIGTGGIQTLLEQVPGILYSRSGGINGQLSIRGMNSNDTRSIVLVDGVRVSGRNTLEFNTFDPNSIESIEVIRGPASSLWGSDAMNGVVNIKTRRSHINIHDPFTLTPRIRAIDFASVNNYIGGRFELIGGGNQWDILVGVNGKRGDDYQTPIGVAKNSGFKTTGGDFNIGYTNSHSTRFYVQGRYEYIITERAGGLGAAPGYPYTDTKEDPLTEQYLRIGVQSYEFGFADKLEAYLYARKYDTDIYNNIVKTIQPVINSYIFGGRMAIEKKLSNHAIIYGVDFYTSLSPQVKLRSQKTDKIIKTLYRPSSFTDMGIFIKDDWNVLESWILSGSLRGDYVLTTIAKHPHYSSESIVDTQLLDANSIINNGALTGALGSVYFFNEYFSNAINLSHNFRVPSPGSRMNSTPAGDLRLQTVANPTLKPEYSQTGEISLRYSNPNHFVSLTGYFTYYSDLITSKTVQAGLYNQYINIGQAYITGAELEGKHSFLDNRLSLNYSATYTYAQDVSNNKPYRYIAPLYGRISLEYFASNWFFRFVQRAYLGKFASRIDPSQERPTKSYAMSDIYFGYNLKSLSKQLSGMDLIMGIENFFNTTGRNPVTVEDLKYPNTLVGNPLVEPGRNFVLKYAYKY
ncbi:TonB-dependent receptor [Helicobacter sp. 11S03491-1]|uniref:TonB-dependent receptor plug domain-containing protein n=1 Tax=Helicobacter sp. 11S03491-1 TaxID=1476196 RepID=UPI000BA643FD|nr:TonB-dependent receptor [Helicobacter sp. 11S03491-1]PAF43435.1 hypothetical protein BKH45_02060 [Helicobacter sp. 11S03491-1]